MSVRFYTDRCDHRWGEGEDEYSKLRTVITGSDPFVGEIAVGVCDQCNAIELRLHATNTVIHIRRDEYAADFAGRERHLFLTPVVFTDDKH